MQSRSAILVATCPSISSSAHQVRLARPNLFQARRFPRPRDLACEGSRRKDACSISTVPLTAPAIALVRSVESAHGGERRGGRAHSRSAPARARGRRKPRPATTAPALLVQSPQRAHGASRPMWLNLMCYENAACLGFRNAARGGPERRLWGAWIQVKICEKLLEGPGAAAAAQPGIDGDLPLHRNPPALTERRRFRADCRISFVRSLSGMRWHRLCRCGNHTSEHSLEITRLVIEAHEAAAQEADGRMQTLDARQQIARACSFVTGSARAGAGRLPLHLICSATVLTKSSVEICRQILLTYKQAPSLSPRWIRVFTIFLCAFHPSTSTPFSPSPLMNCTALSERRVLQFRTSRGGCHYTRSARE